MHRDSAGAPQEIACQQVLMEDASVFSVQWTTVPRRFAAGLTPELLLERYLAYIRRFTFTMIRPRLTAEGVEFRLAGTRASLIRLTTPARAREKGEESLTLAIRGGLLVQPGRRGRGELSFSVEEGGEGVTLRLRLSGYHPLILGGDAPSHLRKWLYRLTQAHLHKVVTVRFLARAYRELSGDEGGVRVVGAFVREGEDI